MSDLLLVLIVVATALNGIAAGASLDQSIKQLPARHRIGAVAYSTYSQAGDLGNGLFWYAGLGMCAVLVSLAATVMAVVQRTRPQHALPIFLVSALWALHLLITLTLAAPTLRSQRRAEERFAEIRVRGSYPDFGGLFSGTAGDGRQGDQCALPGWRAWDRWPAVCWVNSLFDR